MESAQNRIFNILPNSKLTEKEIRNIIEKKLTPLANPIPTMGCFIHLAAEFTPLNPANGDMTRRQLEQRAMQNMFGENGGKITHMYDAGDFIIVQYEGPYEETLEVPAEKAHPRLILERIGAIESTIIAAEQIGKNAVLYLRLENDDPGIFSNLQKNPPRWLRAAEKITKTLLAISALAAVCINHIQTQDRESERQHQQICRKLDEQDKQSIQTTDQRNPKKPDPEIEKRLFECRKKFGSFQKNQDKPENKKTP